MSLRDQAPFHTRTEAFRKVFDASVQSHWEVLLLPHVPSSGGALNPDSCFAFLSCGVPRASPLATLFRLRINTESCQISCGAAPYSGWDLLRSLCFHHQATDVCWMDARQHRQGGLAGRYRRNRTLTQTAQMLAQRSSGGV